MILKTYMVALGIYLVVLICNSAGCVVGVYKICYWFCPPNDNL
jgi:hypothetical protein